MEEWRWRRIKMENDEIKCKIGYGDLIYYGDWKGDVRSFHLNKK